MSHSECSLVSRVREIRTHGSTGGVWRRGMVGIMRHRQTKGPDTDRPNLNHRVTSRLYTFGVVTPIFTMIKSAFLFPGQATDRCLLTVIQ